MVFITKLKIFLVAFYSVSFSNLTIAITSSINSSNSNLSFYNVSHKIFIWRIYFGNVTLTLTENVPLSHLAHCLSQSLCILVCLYLCFPIHLFSQGALQRPPDLGHFTGVGSRILWNDLRFVILI